MTHDVFISHSSKDKALADAVCAALEANGIRCWMAPRDIQPSESWAAAILRGISHGRMMVLIFSAHANTSQHVCREVERAVAHSMPVLPVRVEDVLPAGELEYFLSTSHWLDAMRPPFQEHLRELAATVRAVLETRGASPAAAPELHSPAAFQESPLVRIDADGITAPAGDRRAGGAPAHAGGMDISDSVIKGNVTSGSASVGNINISVGQGATSGSSAELEYEKCVMMTLKSGGSLESIRMELDERRLAIGLPIRLAREIEKACLDSCGRKPIRGRGNDVPTAPAGPAGPDPLRRFFKSASESIAWMFNPAPTQHGPPPNWPTPVPPVHPPTLRPTGTGGPPPVPRLAPSPPAASGTSPAATTAADQAESVKEGLKEELRDGLKADLAQVVEKDAVKEGDSDKPAKSEEQAAPAPRKPPPLPAMPPPLQWPGRGKPGK